MHVNTSAFFGADFAGAISAAGIDDDNVISQVAYRIKALANAAGFVLCDNDYRQG